MDRMSKIFGLMTSILLLSECYTKQEGYVGDTQNNDWVDRDAIQHDNAPFWDGSKSSYMNRPNVLNYKANDDLKPTDDAIFMSKATQYLDDIVLSRRSRFSDGNFRTGNVQFAALMNCKDDEFQCFYDGKCISKMAVCDRNADCHLLGDTCGDRSCLNALRGDELHCPRTDCPDGAFQCNSGECLSYIHRCDGFAKCRDQSDEVGCETSTCPPHFYRCHSGQCIQLIKRCDGNNIIIHEIIGRGGNETAALLIRAQYSSRNSNGSFVYSDCLDGSDEWNCENYICPANNFKCKNGQCASLSARCDGLYHIGFPLVSCNDGSDEEDCDQSECGDYFRCSDGRCLHPSGRCDTKEQCNDASDEKSCDLNNAACPLHSYACRHGHCVPYTYRCTAEVHLAWYNMISNHCPDVSYDDYCPMSKCPNGYFRCRSGQCMRYDICNRRDNVNFCDPETDPTDHCGRTDCPRDYFRCADGHCLHHVSVCDKVPDCQEGEDETHCGRSECREDQVDCGDGNCIPMALKCDTYNHCAGGLDETNCNDFILVGPQLCPGDIDFSFPFITKHCAVWYHKECKGTNGMVNCSSSTVIFTGMVANISIWPFEQIGNGGNRPFYPGHIEMRWIYGLVLSNSLLTIVPVGALRFTPYLQILDLSHNLLTHIKYGDFNGLYRLSLIDVSYNQIHTIDDYAFKGLRVFHLNLENNLIERFGSELFGGVAIDGTIRTDAYKFCCVKPSYLPEHNCFPGAGLFSSCDHLIRHIHLRALLWIIGLFACFGNLLVTVKRLLNARRNRNNRTRYGFFVANLHISDFLMGLYLLIIALADLSFSKRYIFEDAKWRGSVICKLAGVLSMISNEASPMFALCITVDRYFGIKNPLGQKRITYCTSIALATLAWVLSGVLAVVPLIFVDVFEGKFYSSSVVCLGIPLSTRLMEGWIYAVAVYVIFNSLLFICILIGQFAIMHAIFLAKSESQVTSQINEIKVAKSLMVIVLTDFLCWCPVCIMITLSVLGVNLPMDMYSWVMILVLPINAALNPILYTLIVRQ